MYHQWILILKEKFKYLKKQDSGVGQNLLSKIESKVQKESGCSPLLHMLFVLQKK